MKKYFATKAHPDTGSINIIKATEFLTKDKQVIRAKIKKNPELANIYSDTIELIDRTIQDLRS